MNFSLDETRREAAEKEGFAEWYEQVRREPPAPNLGLDAIQQGIRDRYGEMHPGRTIKLNLTVLGIDQDNKTNSFITPMEQLGDFLTKSRERFLNDAIEHLGTLDHFNNRRDRYSLCTALLKAREGGHLSEAHEAKLAGILRDKTAIGETMGLVELNRANRGNRGTATAIFYDDRSRGDDASLGRD